MKKFLALCLTALMTLALLAGCTSADPNHPYDREPVPANPEAQEDKETSTVLPFSWEA